MALCRSGGSRCDEAPIKSFAAPRSVAAPSLERKTAQRAPLRFMRAPVAKARKGRRPRRASRSSGPVGGKPGERNLRPDRTTVNGHGPALFSPLCHRRQKSDQSGAKPRWPPGVSRCAAPRCGHSGRATPVLRALLARPPGHNGALRPDPALCPPVSESVKISAPGTQRSALRTRHSRARVR